MKHTPRHHVPARTGVEPRRVALALFLWMGIAGVLLSSCSESFEGGMPGNEAPDTWVASGPPDSSISGYLVHLFWGGFDPDGVVSHYEYAITDNGPGGVNPEDTTGADKWRRITISDSVFTVKADLPDPTDPKKRRFIRSHTFFVRAVDEHGRADPSPAYRSFTATTLAPEVTILTPVNPRPGDIHALPNTVTMTWEATDEGGTIKADSVRWALFKAGDNDAVGLNRLIDTLHLRNRDPLWSKWISTSAPDDSGTSALLTTLEYPPSTHYAFCVQAKDVAAAITPTFDVRRNVRKIVTKRPTGPILTISEKFVGTVRFLGTLQRPVILTIPSGLALDFAWEADASQDGQTIAGFRYGWDIVDPEDDSEWPVQSDPTQVRAPTVTWSFGQHLLLVEARDNAGAITMGRIQVNIIPFPMSRPLLWVDDARDAAIPSSRQTRPLAFDDDEHDQEWLAVLAHVDDFDSGRDVYDVSENNFRPPPVELIANYQNIIWNAGGSEAGTQPDALPSLIQYVPRCVTTSQVEVNTLSAFLGKGGHIWLCGQYSLSVSVPGSQAGVVGRFPSVMRIDFNATCPVADTSGVSSFPYQDVGLVALDRSTGTENQFREGVAARTPDKDGLFEATAINSDYSEDEIITLPGGIDLQVGIPSMTGRDLFVGVSGGYRNPVTGARIGFDFTDIFNPQYWLRRADVDEKLSRPEFIPLWRHRTNGASVLMIHTEVNGGWSSVHAWREAALPGGRKGVMAKSLYMGFEPYFFEFEQFERLANYVFFVEWQLRYKP